MPRCDRRQRPPRREPNSQVTDLYQRNAHLENALKFVGRHACRYRAQGLCLINCLGALVCDLTGLQLVEGPAPRGTGL